MTQHKGKNMSKISYILPLALLASGAVQAATENPWYAGARLGGTHYSDFSNKDVRAAHEDKDDFVGGAFIGYNFKPWFAMESGYTYLGEAQFDNGGSIEQQGVDLVGKFTLNLSDSVDLFAKAGGFYYFTDGQDQLNGYDDRGVVATTGAGIEYFFNKNVSARFEYQYYHNMEIQDSETNRELTDWDTHFYGISLVYAWGAPAPVAVVAKPAAPMPKAVVEPKPVIAAAPKVAPVVIKPLTVELPFAFDSKTLPPQYINQLQPIAQHLIEHPEAQLFVVGHTDSLGSEAYNQKLSEQRAALIANYLANKFSISKSRVKQTGRGELEPRATNTTEQGRALNRRVSVFTPGLTIQNK